jgi:hypothetical protein
MLISSKNNMDNNQPTNQPTNNFNDQQEELNGSQLCRA